MKRIAFYLSLVLVVLVLASCKKGQKNLFTPTSSGRPYEVLVVVNKPVWDRPAGRALFDVLDTNVPGLPQAERSFRISNVDTQHFDRVLKIFRNIIIVDIQDIYTQPKLKFSRDVYASPQMIMTIQAPNEDEFEEFVAKNSKVIIDFFVKAEMNRQITLLKQKHSDVISTKVGSIFDCNIWVPVELANYKEGKDFLWASTNRATADMNFVMYSYPYTDKDTFTKDYFIHKRDSVMKANIPGEREGMYMATDSMFVDVEDIVVKGEYAQEARGLWEMEGDMMGGPFVSHARVDRANGRVIVVEAFIYSPDKLKRNLMRQMEASLYTLRLPNESLIDNTEICLNIHCFTMISSHFRRSINNGCTKFQHGRIRKSFENYFISYSVDIPMSNTNSYLVVIFHLYYILYVSSYFTRLVVSIFSSGILPLITISSIKLSLGNLNV